MSAIRKVASIAAISAIFAAGSAMAADDSGAAKDHPRRAEVNQRLQNQDKRINSEVKAGEMSKEKALKLHQEDRHIRHEENRMATQNGGGITKSEQKTLNRQENGVSKQIGK